MPDTRLSWGGANPIGSLSLEVTRLRAEGLPVYPQLIIPIRLVITPSVVSSDRSLRVWSMSCSLFLNNNLLSDHQGDVLDQSCYASESGQEFHLRFPFDLHRLQHIERNRHDDACFVIRGKLVFEATGAPAASFTPGRPETTTYAGPTGLFGTSFQLDVRVPRSHWTSTILPAMGWSSIRIVELPVPTNSEWRDTFVASLGELAEAERLFKDGNYDQSVAHCRAAIEPFRKRAQDLKPLLKDTRNGPGVAEKEFSLLHSMSTDTVNWLSGQLERLHTLASVAHHVPAVGHFSRDHAHALLLHATSLVMYAGSAVGSSKQDGPT